MEHPKYKIDEIFRQRLHDAEVPPPPFVWPAVEHALQKRRRRWVIFWFFALSAVAASVWLYWLSGSGLALNEEKVAAPPTAEVSASIQSEPEPTIALQAISKTPDASSAISVPHGKPRLHTSPRAQSDRHGAKVAGTAFNSQPQTSVEEVKTPFVGNIEEFQPVNIGEAKALGKPLEIGEVQSVASLSAHDRGLTLRPFKSRSHRKKAQPKLCYDFTQHPSAWLLDVYVGPSLAQRSLTSRLEDQPYLHQRLATEQRSVAMNAGVRASLMFNSNFIVRTGLHYDQITEVFEYIDPTTVIYRLQFTPGNPIPDTLGVEYGENYLKTYNRYRMLDVPLMVGVEMRRGRSGFSVNAGLSANVLFQNSGVIMDPVTHEPARFGPVPDDPKTPGPKKGLSEDPFRANVGLSASASIQWYWHLSTHFRLFAEPSFRQVLRPITQGSHPVEQRYSILGLRLGATTIF